MLTEIVTAIMWITVIGYMLLFIWKLIYKEVKNLKLLPLIKSLFGKRLKLKDDSIDITRLKKDLNLDILNPSKKPETPQQTPSEPQNQEPPHSLEQDSPTESTADIENKVETKIETETKSE